MAILPIVTYPDSVLKTACEEVLNLDAEILKIIDDLIETMYSHAGCVGIAASQVGIAKRVAIIDASRNPKAKSELGKQVLINPVVVSKEGEVTAREGCLSLPHLTGNVKRPQTITFRATTIEGKDLIATVSDFEARVVLHEIDHLDGLLFLDRVSSLKTDIFRRKRYLPGNPTSGPTSTEDMPALKDET
jgi:peptide deformylase